MCTSVVIQWCQHFQVYSLKVIWFANNESMSINIFADLLPSALFTFTDSFLCFLLTGL